MYDVMIRGCGTALVTPFEEGGRVDEGALRALVEWQITEGVDFLVPCGSTGEAATLDEGERRRVIAVTAEQAAGRIPVVAGAGSGDTTQAVRYARAAREEGATHLLLVSPMYNRPPQRGLIAHFSAIADEIDLPQILYNVPGRTASNMEANTTLALAEHPRIVGVKEASGDIGQIGQILGGRPDGFAVLSGDDAMTLPVMALGGDGVVSVVSNVVPGAMASLVGLLERGELEAARVLHERLLPLMASMFLESNPIPVKAALAEAGRVDDVLRLPLVPMTGQYRARLRQDMIDAEVILP